MSRTPASCRGGGDPPPVFHVKRRASPRITSRQCVERDARLAAPLAVLVLNRVVRQDLTNVPFLVSHTRHVKRCATCIRLRAELLDEDLGQQLLVGARSAAAFGLFAPHAISDGFEHFIESFHLRGRIPAGPVTYAAGFVRGLSLGPE